MTIHTLLLGVALPLGLMAPAMQVTAQTAPPSDTLTVYDATGKIFASASAGEAGEDAGAIIVVPGVSVDANQFNNATGLTESNGKISDVFGVCTCGTNGAFALGFESDTDTVSVPFTPNVLFPERKGAFDATKYLDPSLQRLGYTAQFTSDADVPEPATWGMMLLGFGVIGLVLRRRGRTSASAELV